MMRAQFPAFTIANQNYAAAIAAAFLFAALFTPASSSALAQAPVAEKSTPPTTAQPPAARSTPTQPLNGSISVPTAPTAPAAIVKSFVSIGDKPAILFDAPSTRANKTFIISAYTPLEVLVKLDKLTKVRDADGTVGWVENTTLGERRHVQISAASAEVRVSASPTAALVFDAQRTVVLEVIGAAQDGWLPVKHRDGQSGFVRLTQVWGD